MAVYKSWHLSNLDPNTRRGQLAPLLPVLKLILGFQFGVRKFYGLHPEVVMLEARILIVVNLWCVSPKKRKLTLQRKAIFSTTALSYQRTNPFNMLIIVKPCCNSEGMETA